MKRAYEIPSRAIAEAIARRAAEREPPPTQAPVRDAIVRVPWHRAGQGALRGSPRPLSGTLNDERPPRLTSPARPSLCDRPTA